MQLINIDEIIDELKKTSYWNDYESFLKDNIEIFGKTFLIESLISKKGILNDSEFNLIDNDKKEEDIGKKDIWKWINRKDNFKLFKNLELKFLDLFLDNIKFCPYCGKIPLIRYENDKNEKKGTFHLDHIFPKSKYRYLTYNFYNLIPSCSICNQFKGARNLYNIKGEVFHPYFGWLKKDKKKLKLEKNNFSMKISFKENDYKSKHFKFFNLDKIYLNSQDTKNDILFIRESKEKILVTKSFFKSKSDNELKNYFFKNYAPETEQEILKFSNGKLKKDLIENLKL